MALGTHRLRRGNSGKKVNIVVGGRFNANQIYHAFASLGYDVKLYTSSPARFFKNVPRNNIVFVVKPIQVLQKTLNTRMPRLLSELNAVAFDWLISRFMRRADILWGFNGDSLYCGLETQRHGGLYIVDRACPHFLCQEELLAREAKKIGYPYARFSGRMRNRFVREYEVADAIVVPSNYSHKSFVERGLPEAKLHIIPLDGNASRPASEPAASRRDDAVNDRAFRVGVVGGSFLRKGIIYLLRALKIMDRADIVLRMRASKDNVTVHPEARKLCEELRVEFVPYVDDINVFYRSLDVFVLPSIDEGFGMVVYEALMNGTPVVASSNVGAIDGLMPNEQILVFPAGDERGLAASLERLHSDPHFRLSVGRAGQQFYAEHMKAGSRYATHLERLLNQVLAKRHG